MVTKQCFMKAATDKDQVIESLREKCREFSRLINNQQDNRVQISDVSSVVYCTDLLHVCNR